MVEHIKVIWKDPMDWWRKEEVIKSRKKFCKSFALSKKNWRKVWSNELNKY